MKLFHIYIWKNYFFLLLFLYKYISIHTLLKSVMQLINIMHHRGIVSIIYYLLYYYLLYYYFLSPFLLLPYR